MDAILALSVWDIFSIFFSATSPPAILLWLSHQATAVPSVRTVVIQPSPIFSISQGAVNSPLLFGRSANLTA